MYLEEHRKARITFRDFFKQEQFYIFLFLVSGVDRFKVGAELFPMIDERRHFVREVEKRKVLVLRVVREDGRRKRTNVEAHCGKNRYDDGE